MKEFIPKRSNTLSKQITMGLFILSLVAMFASGVPGLPLRSVMQTVALIVLATAIAMLGRFEFKTYTYTVSTNDDGKLDLVVTELKRRSRITVCRVSIDGISEATEITAENKKQLKEMRKGRKSFNYCIDVAPARSICIIANEGGEELVISLSYIPELFCILGGKK